MATTKQHRCRGQHQYPPDKGGARKRPEGEPVSLPDREAGHNPEKQTPPPFGDSPLSGGQQAATPDKGGLRAVTLKYKPCAF